MLFKSLSALLCGAMTAGAQDVAQGVPRVLVDRELNERQVQLVGLDGRTIVYADAAGLIRNEPVTEYVAVVPPLTRPAAVPTEARPAQDLTPARAWSILELTDGQRFFGDVADGPALKDAVRWAHPMLGVLEFRLDQVRRVRLNMPPEGSWTKPPPPTAPDPKDDTVVFANGDRVSGFVDGLSGTPRQLTVVAGDKGVARTIGLEVVREVVFANPAQAAPAHSTQVWLRDGSVIACRAVHTTRLGELSLVPALQETEGSEAGKTGGVLRLDDLIGAAFDPGTILPLSSLSPVEQKPVGERRWSRPVAVAEADRAVLGAGDIELPGPIIVTWDLPAGATRLAADAELPRQMWAWGDCRIVVSLISAGGETELFSARLNAEQPLARLAVAIPGPGRLAIRVEPGAFGPVQNRVVLHRPILMVGKKS